MADWHIPSAEGVSMFDGVNALANRAEAAEARVAELEAALRETVATLRRIHVHVKLAFADDIDGGWIEEQAAFMLDRWGQHETKGNTDGSP